MTDALSLPRLVATTREIDPVDDLLRFASATEPLAWIRRGDGMVAAGSLLEIGVGEDGRLDALADLWRGLSQAADVDDEVRLAGTGLVAFGAFAFDETSASPSTLVVPRMVIGRRGGRHWRTTITRAGREPFAPPEPTDLGAQWSATLGPGEMDPAAHAVAVREALDAIERGEVGKVVVARDIAGTVPAGADLRRLIRELADGYPDTWAFAVDGVIGASPETLVTVSGGAVTARVLAGTSPRGADDAEDAELSARLAASEKNVDEHGYAVRSVLEALRPHTSELHADAPFILQLPNLWHLATDVEATLSNGSSALDLVRALHPTAAVAGTPREAAMGLIRRIEPFDRGRYAGPVGWIDGDGDGEWAIALRCAQFGSPDASPTGPELTRTVVAHAGGGIVAGSASEPELLETRVKFRPIIDALA